MAIAPTKLCIDATKSHWDDLILVLSSTFKYLLETQHCLAFGLMPTAAKDRRLKGTGDFFFLV